MPHPDDPTPAEQVANARRDREELALIQADQGDEIPIADYPPARNLSSLAPPAARRATGRSR